MKKIFFIVISFVSLFGANLHFSMFEKKTDEGPTLFIVGGIHGNEPGGFFAPAVFKNHYKIVYGNVKVIPNLNFDSIAAGRRGIYGDMNRKFAVIKANDKDFDIVKEIKEEILKKDVDLIVNLHDGHGFYREKEIDGLFNPKAWGQACIIDQQNLPNVKFGNLAEIAKKVSQENNIDLIEDVHEFNVKNTHTKEKDKAMRQSLTYFAIEHNKPAFAIETSKNIRDLNLKVFYQLKTIEKFMKIMGIKFERDFDLTVENITKILEDRGVLAIPKKHISLVLNDIRSYVNNFPMDNENLEYFSKNPLIAVIKDRYNFKVMNGNKFVTRLVPEMYNFDDTLKDIEMLIDGVKQTKHLGDIVDVKSSFNVLEKDGYRVNVIGFVSSKSDLETGVDVYKKDFMKRFSLDNSENIYRVEFYKGKSFCGMILVRYLD